MSDAREQWTSQCGREQCSSVVQRCGLCWCDDEIVDDQDYVASCWCSGLLLSMCSDEAVGHLSTFMVLAVGGKFTNHWAFSELHIGTHINQKRIVQSCKFPHLVQSSTLHQAGRPSPIKQAGPRPLKSQRKSRRAWEMSYVLHRYLDTWSIMKQF